LGPPFKKPFYPVTTEARADRGHVKWTTLDDDPGDR
jgi:hypothetical protein